MAKSRDTHTPWWRYVVTVTGNAVQKDIAAATGIDQSSISRWQRATNTPRAEAVVALARAYGRSPVEALVAAGYLSSDEVGVVELTTLTGDLTKMSIDSLLSEVRRRVRAGNADDTEAWPRGWSADDDPTKGHLDGRQRVGDLGGRRTQDAPLIRPAQRRQKSYSSRPGRKPAASTMSTATWKS